MTPQPSGGNPVTFPKPVLSNVNYRLDKVYSKAGPFEELESLLDRHKAARYRVTDYIRPEVADKPEYRDLFRARNRIARLMRALLFKRLESSIEAFRSTLRSLIRSNRNFREALSGGYVPIGSTATRLLSGDSFDADETLEILQQEEDRRQGNRNGRTTLVHSTDDFKTDDWIASIDADYKVLSEILGRVEHIGPDDDDKLRVLRSFLNRNDVKSEKILIFSEAETTIEYLYNQLNPNDENPEIARLSGNTRSNAENIIKRFSPTWNLGANETTPGAEIRVLLATDIVSEGQNLQDCARILNYDLHWNPVRLIQRFGRIDRIGSEHDVIHLHNMWPDTAVDEELDLTGRLHNRIQSFHDLIGLDSKLLSDAERLNEKEMYAIYNGDMPEAEDGLDEVAANQRAIALLQRIQDSDPDLWKTITNLPDGIRSALSAGPHRADDGSRAIRGIEGSQTTLVIEGSQAPLMSSSAGDSMPSPFDEPGPGETLVLLSEGGVKGCYAVAVDRDGVASYARHQPRTVNSRCRVLPGHTRSTAAARHECTGYGRIRDVPGGPEQASGQVEKTPRQSTSALRVQAVEHRSEPSRRGGYSHHRDPAEDIPGRPVSTGRERVDGDQKHANRGYRAGETPRSPPRAVQAESTRRFIRFTTA